MCAIKHTLVVLHAIQICTSFKQINKHMLLSCYTVMYTVTNPWNVNQSWCLPFYFVQQIISTRL